MTNTTDERLNGIIQEWLQLASKDMLYDNRLSPSHFSLEKEGNHDLALKMFKYVIEDIFKMTPREALDFINADFVISMGLKSVYEKIIYPEYISKRSHYNYLVKLCYPNEISEFDEKSIWQMEYNNALSTNKTLSKKCFSNINGREKAEYLLKSYLNNNFDKRYSTTKKEAYKFFASAEAKPFLKEIGLLTACNLLFDSPLEYYHETLNDKNELYYEFNNFKNISRGV